MVGSSHPGASHGGYGIGRAAPHIVTQTFHGNNPGIARAPPEFRRQEQLRASMHSYPRNYGYSNLPPPPPQNYHGHPYGAMPRGGHGGYPYGGMNYVPGAFYHAAGAAAAGSSSSGYDRLDRGPPPPLAQGGDGVQLNFSAETPVTPPYNAEGKGKGKGD